MTDQSNGTQSLARTENVGPLSQALELDNERFQLLTRTIARGCTRDELHLFLAVAARCGLDPFLKQIYPIKANSGFFIHVGIDGRRLIAQRTGLVDGTLGPFWAGADGEWRDVWLSDEKPKAARFGVLKKGCREPFWAVAHLKGFGLKTGRWETDAAHMLALRAEDHAWRKAFPYEMGNLPAYRPEQDEPEQPQPDDGDGDYREVDRETGEIHEAAPVQRSPRAQAVIADMEAAVAEADADAAQPDQEDQGRGQDEGQEAQVPVAGPPPDALDEALGPKPERYAGPLPGEVAAMRTKLDARGLVYQLPQAFQDESFVRDWLGRMHQRIREHDQGRSTAGARRS